MEGWAKYIDFREQMIKVAIEFFLEKGENDMVLQHLYYKDTMTIMKTAAYYLNEYIGGDKFTVSYDRIYLNHSPRKICPIVLSDDSKMRGWSRNTLFFFVDDYDSVANIPQGNFEYNGWNLIDLR